MKQIFDKSSLLSYIRSEKRLNKYDNIALIILASACMLFILSIIDYDALNIITSILISCRIFLSLNLKAKLKEYKNKFDEFYNKVESGHA
jgi:hypothetical protein